MSTSVVQDLQKSRQLISEKRYEEAISLLESNRTRTIQQNDDYFEALILDQLGVAWERQGKFLAARNAFDQSISKLTRLRGKDCRDLVPPLNNLANLLYESDQGSEAEALVRRSLGILGSAGRFDDDTGVELAILAKMSLGAGKISVAQQSAERSLQIFRESGHSEDLPASIAWSVLGGVYGAQRNAERAEEALKQALSILQVRLGPQDYRVTEGIANLGLLYASLGLPAKAEPLLDQAHKSFRSEALNTLFVRKFLEAWAVMERKSGRKQKARALLSEAKSLLAARSEGSMSRFLVDANAAR